VNGGGEDDNTSIKSVKKQMYAICLERKEWSPIIPWISTPTYPCIDIDYMICAKITILSKHMVYICFLTDLIDVLSSSPPPFTIVPQVVSSLQCFLPKILYKFLISPVYVTCSINFISLLDHSSNICWRVQIMEI
jgi:hypothetical protein